MSNNKVKGILKGLRYISQIFDNEKEHEMEIGLPTDVKHVAHIGWDGPSVNSPTWLNEFKSPSGFSSASLSLPEDHMRDNNGRRSAGADPNSPTKELSEPPRSSRRQSSSSSTIDSVTESPITPNRGKLEKPKQSRKSSKSSIKDSPDDTKVTRVTCLSSDSNQAGSSVLQAHSLPVPDIPKKARRNKSKEHSLSNGSKKSSRLKSQDSPEPYQSSFSHAETYHESPFSNPGPGSESIST